MKRTLLLLLTSLVTTLLALPLHAEDESAYLSIGSDIFSAGRAVSHDESGADDVFLAGETVANRADIGGSAFLAGRDVMLDGKVGGDVFAAGDSVTLKGTVTGDATLAGRAVSVGTVGQDLRAGGSSIQLAGDIGGYAIVGGERLVFDARVGGDMRLAAESVEWGDNASIGGRLLVYEEKPGTLQVPERVIAADRVERRAVEEWDGPQPPSLARVVAGFIGGVLVVAALAALIAALVPERLAEMRRQILARPFRTLWLGFLGQSTVIGAGLLFAVTLIGLLLTPAMLLLAVVLAFAGYVIGTYAFGVGLLSVAGKAEPDSFGTRALAAGVGALIAGLIALVPILGWLFVIAVVLAGIGAITARVLRPLFFADGLVTTA